jgi:hypothetical protein
MRRLWKKMRRLWKKISALRTVRGAVKTDFRGFVVGKSGFGAAENTIFWKKEGESGKDVYVCLQYENAKGGEEGRGPCGPIMHAVIP